MKQGTSYIYIWLPFPVFFFIDFISVKIDFIHIIEEHSFLNKCISQRYPNML